MLRRCALRDQTPQLLEPVDDDADLRGGRLGFARYNHQKTSTVHGDIVARGPGPGRLEVALEEQTRYTGRKRRLECNRYRHHGIPVAIEQLAGVTRPDRLLPPIGRGRP